MKLERSRGGGKRKEKEGSGEERKGDKWFNNTGTLKRGRERRCATKSEGHLQPGMAFHEVGA